MAAAKGAGRRFMVLVFVLLLAVGLIGAQSVATDLAAGYLLRDSLRALPYDYLAEQFSDSPSELAAAIAPLNNVNAVTYAFFVSTGAEGRLNGRRAPAEIMGVAAGFGARAFDLGFTRNFTLGAGETALAIREATWLGAHMGSSVELGYDSCKPATGNCTFVGRSFVVSAVVQTWKDTSASVLLDGFMAFLSESDAKSLSAQLFPSGEQRPLYYFPIWVDHSAILNPLDPDGSLRRATAEQFRIETVTGPGSVKSPLETALQSYRSQLLPLEGFFLTISAPSLILASAMVFTGLDRATSEGVRRLRLLRIRGASLPLSIGSLVAPPALLAAAAIAAGFLLLPYLFEILLSSAGLFQVTLATFPGWDLAQIPVLGLIGGLLVFGCAFVLYGKTVAARLAEPAKKWQDFALRLRHPPILLDLVLVATAVILWTYLALHGLVRNVAPGLDVVVGGLAAALLPLAGAFFVGGITRPTLRLRRVRHGLGRVCSGIGGSLGKRYLRERLTHSPPPSSIPLVISIAVALLVLTFGALASERTFLEKERIARVGGDIAVDAQGNQSIFTRLAQLPGVQAVAEAEIRSPIQSDFGSVVLLNSSSYESVVPLDPYFFAELPGSVHALLQGPTVLINTPAVEAAGLHVGDDLSASFGSQQLKVVRIAGIVKTLPGLQPDLTFSNPVVYGDLASFVTLFGGAAVDNPGNWRILMKLAPGTSEDAIVHEILADFPEVIRVVAGEAAIGGTTTADLAEPFLAIESFVSSLLVVSAVGGLSLILLAGRRAEVASLRVRGAARGTIANLLFGEALAGVVLGFTLGIIGGLASSWFFVDSLSTIVDPSPLNRPFVISWDMPLLLGAFALAVIGIIAVVSWMASEPRLVSVLRERSQ